MDGAPVRTKSNAKAPVLVSSCTSKSYFRKLHTRKSHLRRGLGNQNLPDGAPHSLKGFSRTYQRNFEARASVRKFYGATPISAPISLQRVPSSALTRFFFSGGVSFRFVSKRRATIANNPPGYYPGVRRSH